MPTLSSPTAAHLPHGRCLQGAYMWTITTAGLWGRASSLRSSRSNARLSGSA